MAGVVGAREERKIQSLAMKGEGWEGDDLFRYTGTDTGDTQVGG